MPRKKSILTEKQSKYVEAVLDGKPKSKAATDAGYSSPIAYAQTDRSKEVQFYLSEARRELSSAVQVKRADMIVVLLDAIDMARFMADPMAMIAGAREVGKMLGLYAPEEKKIDLTVNQARLRSEFEALTDEQLVRVIEGEVLESVQ